VASSRLRLSRDGKFLAATGVYPPQVKVYELSELSMKFERHMDCEVVQFEILSDDYSKMAFLQADRTIEIHAKFGTYYKTRIPKVATQGKMDGFFSQLPYKDHQNWVASVGD